MKTLLPWLTLSVLALAGGWLTSSSHSASAAFPGTNGKLALTRVREGRSALYVLDMRSKKRTVLIGPERGNSVEPSWSASGSRVAFVNAPTSGLVERVLVSDARGSKVETLVSVRTDSPEAVLFVSPRWSPSGKELIFERWEPAANRQALYLTTTRSKRTRRVLEGALTPAWSPNGAWIAYATRTLGGDADIYLMRRDGTQRRLLVKSPGDDLAPEWSPSGARVAFVSNQDGRQQIYTIRADGNAVRKITSHSAGNVMPSWSPDGRKIAFASRRFGRQFDLFLTNADGTGGEVRLTTSPDDEMYPAWQPMPRRR